MESNTSARHNFPATRWSIVLQARDAGNSSAGSAALEELCRLYWYPIYAFARRRGHTPADAEDAAQSFFAELLEDRLFAIANPAKGKLRTFLLAAFQHHLADTRRRANAQKRGSGRTLLSIDRDDAEDRFRAEPAAQHTPEAHYERQWALTLLERGVTRLADEYAEANKAGHFAALRLFLSLEDGGEDYAVVSARLGCTRAAARQAVHRLRERFREVLRSEVANTLQNPDDDTVDAELVALRLALSS